MKWQLGLYAAAFLAANLLTPSAPADALYGVYTNASTSQGFGCGMGTSYSTAAGANSSYGSPQGGLTCTSSINSSTPSGVGATSAISQVQTSLDVISGYFCCDGQTDTQTAYAAADLASGELHASATDVNNYNGTGQGGYANLGIFDTLYFIIPGATSSTVTDLSVTFEYDGVLSNAGQLRNGIGNGTRVQFGNGGSLWGDSGCSPSGFASFQLLACSASEFILQGTIEVTGATATVPIAMGFAFQSGGNDDADFSQTASVTLQLPEGVTYTSASGVFLTETGAPEPQAWVLMLAGLGLFAVARSRLRWHA